jgi:phasin family protein
MNRWNPEQDAAAQRASMEAAFALANKAFGSIQEVIDLNLQTIRSGIGDAEEVMLDTLSGRGPQEWSILSGGAAKRVASRWQSYYGHLSGIASRSQLEFANVVSELYVGQQRRLQALIDGATQHAPGNAITAMTAAITATGAWYETTRKAAHALQFTESNGEAAGGAAEMATRRPTEQPSRTASK